MDVATVDRFFAIMTLLTLAGVIGAIGLGLASRYSEGAAEWRDWLWGWFDGLTLWLAWAVALVSMLGSLYYSEIVHYAPCSLCWYQRIAMYPLVVILAIAAWRSDTKVRRYVIPLVVIGGVIALYQYILGYIPDAEILGCTLDVSCTERYVWEFGFVDFPFMSLVGFGAIGVLLLCPPIRATGVDE